MELFKRSPPRGCWVVGHRGAMAYAPENTMASFRLGLALGADFVECDVHLSRDGRCIVMHDGRLDRTTDGRGLLKDLSAAQIRRLDAGSWYGGKFEGEKVPPLSELLAWAKGRKTLPGLPLGVVIEIKDDPAPYRGIENAVVREVLRAGMQGRVAVISFDHAAVKRIKALRKDFSTGILYAEKLADPFARARQVNADALFPRRNLVNRSLVAEARKKGLLVAVWTVNEAPEMRRLQACGVAAMASNAPDRLAKTLERNLK